MSPTQNGHDPRCTIEWVRACPQYGAVLRKSDPDQPARCACGWEWA
jgi:hypothetical protein